MTLLICLKTKQTNQHNKTETVTDTENKLVAAKEERCGGTNKTGETQTSSNKIHES